MPLTIETKNKILSAFTGKSNYTNSIYLALFNGNPAESGTEVSATNYGYARTAAGVYGSNGTNWMDTPSNGSVSNKSTIYFPEATGSWGTVDYIALYSSATGGTLLGYAHIVDDAGDNTSLTIDEGKVPLVRAGKLTFSFVDAE